jgi:hypothetical protein
MHVCNILMYNEADDDDDEVEVVVVDQTNEYKIISGLMQIENGRRSGSRAHTFTVVNVGVQTF